MGAIIGGTGIGPLLGEMGGRPICVPTPFGSVRGRVISHEGQSIFALQRHSAGHRVAPHNVPYAALGYALASLEVEACVASAAVGSLRLNWHPGDMAACSTFIDLTGRQATRYASPPRHCDMRGAMIGAQWMVQAAEIIGHRIHDGAVYVGMDGPRYESPAEIKMLQELGGDVVGMTASSEAIALAESGIPYGCLAVVTNYGAGLQRELLTHEEVSTVMHENSDLILTILLEAILIGLAQVRTQTLLGMDS